MVKFEKRKRWSLLAALCYTFYPLCCIIVDLSTYISNSDDTTITASDIISWLAPLVMAVTIFIGNKRAVLLAAGINICLWVYVIINFFNYLGFLQGLFYDLRSLGSFLAYAGILSLIILSLKGNAVVKKIWFIPAAIMLLAFFTFWIYAGYFQFLSFAWMIMAINIVEIAAFLFTGIWIKGDTTLVNKAPVNEYSTFNPQAVHSAPASHSSVGGADKLKMYKELLDSGTITQEEFEAKKKKILGL